MMDAVNFLTWNCSLANEQYSIHLGYHLEQRGVRSTLFTAGGGSGQGDGQKWLKRPMDAARIDIDSLNCGDCPALHLRIFERIRAVEEMRLDAYCGLEASPRLILLCESPPKNRFVYDLSTEYSSSGLRANLRKELVPKGDDESLFDFLNERGIWIVDAALCPLHMLDDKTQRRHAATICLQRHTHVYLENLQHVHIVSIFPSRCGILKNQLPSIVDRIKTSFGFSNLNGLKEIIDQLAPPNPNESSDVLSWRDVHYVAEKTFCIWVGRPEIRCDPPCSHAL